ncbi:MAG TPA: aminomethyltransferase beta-barrel domain-containing protein, partial [Parvibaculum sp.]
LGDDALDAAAARGVDMLVKVRSTSAPIPARLGFDAQGRIEVVLAEGEDGVAPGQACVFYDAGAGMRVLGGGFIAEALSDAMGEMSFRPSQAAAQ